MSRRPAPPPRLFPPTPRGRRPNRASHRGRCTPSLSPVVAPLFRCRQAEDLSYRTARRQNTRRCLEAGSGIGTLTVREPEIRSRPAVHRRSREHGASARPVCLLAARNIPPRHPDPEQDADPRPPTQGRPGWAQADILPIRPRGRCKRRSGGLRHSWPLGRGTSIPARPQSGCRAPIRRRASAHAARRNAAPPRPGRP